MYFLACIETLTCGKMREITEDWALFLATLQQCVADITAAEITCATAGAKTEFWIELAKLSKTDPPEAITAWLIQYECVPYANDCAAGKNILQMRYEVSSCSHLAPPRGLSERNRCSGKLQTQTLVT